MGRETNKQRRQAQAQSVREKAAAARAVQQRSDQRRRAVVILSSVVALAVVGVLIAVIAINSSGSKDTSKGTAASQSILDQVTSIPRTVSDPIGAGPVVSTPESVTGGTPLDANGKPTLLFIGAEFCPFCAVER
ncbi:MAG: hypothetical protein JO246_07990, partial [Frankiaceae bacterium]|nr:hypothetical protein [Frankiaceae bacterium]